MTKHHKKTHSGTVKKTNSGAVKKTNSGAVKKTNSVTVKKGTSINEIDDVGNFRIIYEIINEESFKNNQISTNDPQFFKILDYDFLKLSSSVFFELKPNVSYP